MSTLKPVLLAAAFSLATFSAHAAEATCREYLLAQKEDRSLLDGFIYGSVMAKMQGRTDAEINAATIHAKNMTEGYCRMDPKARASSVITLYTDVVARFNLYWK